MKTIKILGIMTTLIMVVLSACGQTSEKPKADTIREKGFAVLEMFTSEGCSSCPPADDLMARIQNEKAGRAIYLLSYHVDYWNRQGWKDIYSSVDYSDRQKKYAVWLKSPQIYTPQLVINGKLEFVGSDEVSIRNAINKQLDSHSETGLEIHANQQVKSIDVHYNAKNAPKGASLILAIVQKTAISQIAAGENAGRLLTHIEIVRQLQTQQLNDNGIGNLKVSLPKGFDALGYHILGLIQDNSSGEILAVAQTGIQVH